MSTLKNAQIETIQTNKLQAENNRQRLLSNEKITEKSISVIKGGHYVPKELLGTSKKTVKGDGKEFLTRILYFAPAFLSGKNTCSKASIGCSNSCLFQNGFGRYDNTQIGRINKTNYFYNEREKFMKQLCKEIAMFEAECKFEEVTPVIRLNGTSDLNLSLFNYKGKNILDWFKNVIFYDYTKVLKRFDTKLVEKSNYFLTASRDENNFQEVEKLLNKGFNVAFVFNAKKNKPLPTEYKGFKVVDGDKNDLRHIDYLENKGNKKGVIVGLIAKGKAKTDKTGFTIHEF